MPATEKPRTLNLAALKARGWTPAKIRDWLGEPDATGKNPVYATAAPMRLYHETRVLEQEAAHPEWFAARSGKVLLLAEAALSKAQRAAAATKARQQREVEWAKRTDLKIRPCNLDEKEARKRAQQHACEVSDVPAVGDRALNNWLRHRRTNYDKLLTRIAGNDPAYQILRRRIETALREVYPWAPPPDPPREKDYGWDMYGELSEVEQARQRLSKAKALQKERAASRPPAAELP